MKTKISTFVISILLCSTLLAQTTNELSAYVGTGLSTLNYETTIGELKGGWGGQLGIGYKYFFTQHVGVGSGLELNLYTKKYQLDNLTDAYMAKDPDGDDFEFRSKIYDYREGQRTMYLAIPLMLQFRPQAKQDINLALGIKAGININGKYKPAGKMKTSGYYEFENIEYTDIEFLGFGEYRITETSKSLHFKPLFALSAEAGIKWKLNGQKARNRRSLYTGIYFDYGLNNIRQGSRPTEPFVEYNPLSENQTLTSNSIFNAHYTHTGKVNNFSNEIKIVAVGLKIGFSFNFSSQGKYIQEQGMWGRRTAW